MTRFSLLSGPVTGARFFAIFASFFVVIIAVNGVLAYQAIRTFPGLEVANSYVASQSFDADRAAQMALGWTVSASVSANASGEVLRVTITDANGAPVRAARLTAIFGRATSIAHDQSPAFQFDGAAYQAALTDVGGPITPGKWDLRLTALAQDGTPFQQRLSVTVH